MICPVENALPESTIGFEIFDETLHPLNVGKVDRRRMPSLATVIGHIREISKIGQLAPETLVMSIVSSMLD
jgi:hypothetical protein